MTVIRKVCNNPVVDTFQWDALVRGGSDCLRNHGCIAQPWLDVFGGIWAIIDQLAGLQHDPTSKCWWLIWAQPRLRGCPLCLGRRRPSEIWGSGSKNGLTIDTTSCAGMGQRRGTPDRFGVLWEIARLGTIVGLHVGWKLVAELLKKSGMNLRLTVDGDKHHLGSYDFDDISTTYGYPLSTPKLYIIYLDSVSAVHNDNPFGGLFVEVEFGVHSWYELART